MRGTFFEVRSSSLENLRVSFLRVLRVLRRRQRKKESGRGCSRGGRSLSDHHSSLAPFLHSLPARRPPRRPQWMPRLPARRRVGPSTLPPGAGQPPPPAVQSPPGGPPRPLPRAGPDASLGCPRSLLAPSAMLRLSPHPIHFQPPKELTQLPASCSFTPCDEQPIPPPKCSFFFPPRGLAPSFQETVPDPNADSVNHN